MRAARSAIAELLRGRGWAATDVGRAQLAVSELVANAVIHAHSRVTVRVSVDGRVRLEVSDTDPRAIVMPRTVEPEHLGGRGLRLVADVSRSWGVQRGTRGKTVWCEVEPGARSFWKAG